MGRPFIIRMIECKGVLIEGVALRNSASWMEDYLACDNLTIRGIKVHNFVAPNNDCIDIDGCQNVHISGVVGNSDDDGLCFKGTSLRPTKNVVVENCEFHSHCNSLKFGTDSQGGLENVHVRNLKLGQPSPDARFFVGRKEGISGMSWEVVDGATMQNVTIDNIEVRGTWAPIFLRLGDRGRHLSDKPHMPPGVLRNVTISNVHAQGAVAWAVPSPDLPATRSRTLRFGTSTSPFPAAGPQNVVRKFDERRKAGDYPEATLFASRCPAFGLFCWHVQGLTLENVRLTTLRPDQRPDIALEDAHKRHDRRREIDKANPPAGVLFLPTVAERQ